MKEYTTDSLKVLLEPIFQKFGPELVYYFGSASRGKTGPLSDIDLAVLWPVGENVPMLKSLRLQDEIQAVFGDSRFEVGCLNGQNLSFCYNVISTGRCIFGKEEDRVMYETRLLSEYLDFDYLAEEYNRAFDRRTLGKN